MQKVLIFGLGLSGAAAAEWLLGEGAQVVAVDRRAEDLRKTARVNALLERGLELFLESELPSYLGVDFAILSPGFAREHPLVQSVDSLGIEVMGELEFALRRLPQRCVGITGTNGKTTTTLLTEHVLRSCGFSVRALGNVGTSLSTYLSDARSEDILVLELSSFQLETLKTRSLLGAVILNITPDHLDRYASMQHYVDAKMNIALALKEEKNFFVSEQAYGYTKKGTLFDTSFSSCQNEQAAYHLASLFGVKDSDCLRSFSTFKKPPHRIEWVAEKNGSVYYNDSKATNVEAVMHAVNSLPGPLILLIGGLDKGAPYTPWINCFLGKVKMLIAFGEAASKMEMQLASAFPFFRVSTLAEAVALAARKADEKTSVLLSPGCSSYDQFQNYEHRGDEFKRLVKEWREIGS